ncbi:NPCBM/NEW2 domain-containing protein [Streptomyces sp. NPDC049967]|uniref:NPCBM/NEW2 domain-containing protein n=1 Tax=Streptomyces sp. NPDC049967 TaxID=3155658 RepID=UPI003429D685
MAHDQGSDERTVARREEQKRKDDLKKAFGERLRVLLGLAGLSSREFAQRYPAYKDSTVRKYVLGASLPPWDFLHDLLTEVTRRTDDPAGPQRRTELFTAYRQVLVDIGANIRGSDQNSLLLRLLDGEEVLARFVEELAEVRARESQLREDLEEEIRRTWPPMAPDSEDRQHQLEEERRLLAERRNELVRRRGELIAELDGCRARLAVIEEADGSGDVVPVSSGSGAGLHQPPMPSTPPELSPGTVPTKPGGRRAAVLIGGALAVMLLAGGGAAIGIWATDTRDKGSETASPSGTPASATSSPSSAAPSVSPTPTNTVPTPSASPDLEPSFSPPSGRTWSLVRDLAPLEDGDPWKYESGKVRVNARDYPTTLQESEANGTWQLDRKYTSLVTRLGVSDESSSGDSVVFTIEVDDEKKREITMVPGQDAESMTVDLRDAFRVTLSVKNPSIGLTAAVGAWIDPVLTK